MARSPQPSRAVLVAAEVQPDVGQQPRSGGDSNLRTNVRSHTRAGQAELLVGGGSRGGLPSAPAAGSAHSGGRRESRGGFIKGPVEIPTEGVTLSPRIGKGLYKSGARQKRFRLKPLKSIC